MPLLEWLRKVNVQTGDINRWVKERHRDHLCIAAHDAQQRAGHSKNPRQVREQLLAGFKRRPKEEAKMSFATFVRGVCHAVAGNADRHVPELESFANDCEMRGEKLIAAETVSRLNDRYYGQWLALHHPFRELDALQVKNISEKVPERYAHLATAIHHRADYWQDENLIKKDMMLEAQNDDFIETVLHKVRAQTHHVHLYLSGILGIHDAVSSSDESAGRDDKGTCSNCPVEGSMFQILCGPGC